MERERRCNFFNKHLFTQVFYFKQTYWYSLKPFILRVAELVFLTLDFESNILLINTNYVKLLKIVVSLQTIGLQGIL